MLYHIFLNLVSNLICFILENIIFSICSHYKFILIKFYFEKIHFQDVKVSLIHLQIK